jgi:hypothetical protein
MSRWKGAVGGAVGCAGLGARNGGVWRGVGGVGVVMGLRSGGGSVF